MTPTAEPKNVIQSIAETQSRLHRTLPFRCKGPLRGGAGRSRNSADSTGHDEQQEQNAPGNDYNTVPQVVTSSTKDKVGFVHRTKSASSTVPRPASSAVTTMDRVFTPPGAGKMKTKIRNSRRKRTRKLVHLKEIGVLPDDANLAAMATLSSEGLEEHQTSVADVESGGLEEHRMGVEDVDQDESFDWEGWYATYVLRGQAINAERGE